jgi:hypothetical protein
MADIDRQVEKRERRLRPSAIIIPFPLDRTRRLNQEVKFWKAESSTAGSARV